MSKEICPKKGSSMDLAPAVRHAFQDYYFARGTKIQNWDSAFNKWLRNEFKSTKTHKNMTIELKSAAKNILKI